MARKFLYRLLYIFMNIFMANKYKISIQHNIYILLSSISIDQNRFLSE